MIFNNVVLPQPERPRMAKVVPEATSKETFVKMRLSENFLCISLRMSKAIERIGGKILVF